MNGLRRRSLSGRAHRAPQHMSPNIHSMAAPPTRLTCRDRLIPAFARSVDPDRSRSAYSDPRKPKTRRSPPPRQAATVAETFRPGLPIIPAMAAPRPPRLLHPLTSAAAPRSPARALMTEHAVERASHSPTVAIEHVRGDHGRTHVLVPEQFLDRVDVVPTLEQMSREAVPQRMAARSLRQPCSEHRLSK